MSDRGSDEFPDLLQAQYMAYDQALLPMDNSYVSQWSYDNDIVVRQFMKRNNATNIAFKIQE